MAWENADGDADEMKIQRTFDRRPARAGLAKTAGLLVLSREEKKK